MALELWQLVEFLKSPQLRSKIPAPLKENFGMYLDSFIEVLIPLLDEKKIALNFISRASSYSSHTSTPSACETPLSVSPPGDTGIFMVSPQFHHRTLSPPRPSAFRPLKTLTQILQSIEKEVVQNLFDAHPSQINTTDWSSLYTHFIEKVVPSIEIISELVMKEEDKQEQLIREMFIKERNASEYRRGAEIFSRVANQFIAHKDLSRDLVHLTALVKCTIHPGLLDLIKLKSIISFKYAFFYIDLQEYRGLYKLHFDEGKKARLLQLHIDSEQLSELKLRTTDSSEERRISELENDKVNVVDLTSIWVLQQFSVASEYDGKSLSSPDETLLSKPGRKASPSEPSEKKRSHISNLDKSSSPLLSTWASIFKLNTPPHARRVIDVSVTKPVQSKDVPKSSGGLFSNGK